MAALETKSQEKSDATNHRNGNCFDFSKGTNHWNACKDNRKFYWLITLYVRIKLAGFCRKSDDI
jgi:hypothetical protein